MDLNALLRGIRKRHSSNPINQICAIAFPFMKYNYATDSYMTLPIYDSNTPNSVAWEKLISSLASTTMEFYQSPRLDDIHGWDFASRLPYTATIQLLYLFPHPSNHHWFPSWSQVQKYPNVSVRDTDPSETASGIDYSLRIMSGRIYRGCSLQLIKPPTPETKGIYCSTVDGKDAQIVATVPGIELHIDLGSKYVLVDMGHTDGMCINTDKGHEHLPIWPKSVIIVCEEVDTLAPECPSADITYRLRRVTTLEWECRQPDQPDGCWLPFEPSLEHMRSIVCSAKGFEFVESPDNKDIDLDIFCDPVVVASLLSQEGWHKNWPQGWHSRWPGYEVYLV